MCETGFVTNNKQNAKIKKNNVQRNKSKICFWIVGCFHFTMQKMNIIGQYSNLAITTNEFLPSELFCIHFICVVCWDRVKKWNKKSLFLCGFVLLFVWCTWNYSHQWAQKQMIYRYILHIIKNEYFVWLPKWRLIFETKFWLFWFLVHLRLIFIEWWNNIQCTFKHFDILVFCFIFVGRVLHNEREWKIRRSRYVDN